MIRRIFLLSTAATFIATNGFAQAARVTTGHPRSLIETAESFVIIPGESHEDLWVHPELVSVPGAERVEFRVRPTDRRGKDKHGDFLYFSTKDHFRTLQPLSDGTAPYWARTRFSKKQLETVVDLKVPSLGHTWASPYLFTDRHTFLQAFTTRKGNRNSVQSLLVNKTDGRLTPVHISNSFTKEKGRGLYEPHVAEYNGNYYLSARAEDGHGYVLVSKDKGHTWSEPVAWKWDDGTAIPMNQTMTKILSHSRGLVLVYTRITPDNAETFRNRAPLFCADIDPETLRLKKDTEITIVPDKGLPVGNFWVWPVSRKESYITTAEWPRDGNKANGDIWLIKIKWKSPNRQLNRRGEINVP